MSGKDLRRILKRLGWTQSRLAQKLGRSTSCISRWCNDKPNCDEMAAKAIRAIVGRSGRKWGKS